MSKLNYQFTGPQVEDDVEHFSSDNHFIDYKLGSSNSFWFKNQTSIKIILVSLFSSSLLFIALAGPNIVNYFKYKNQEKRFEAVKLQQAPSNRNISTSTQKAKLPLDDAVFFQQDRADFFLGLSSLYDLADVGSAMDLLSGKERESFYSLAGDVFEGKNHGIYFPVEGGKLVFYQSKDKQRLYIGRITYGKKASSQRMKTDIDGIYLDSDGVYRNR